MAVKILVVDDATFIRDMIKKQLRDNVPQVEIFDAADGVRALVVLKQNPVDIILSDWEMPLMNGEELLCHVRASDWGAKTPFIMITSRGDRDHVVKAVQKGVSDYITKPFTPEELIRKVYKQLRIINKVPAVGAPKAATQGIAASSISVLTGGAKPAAVTTVAAVSATVSALLGASAPTKAFAAAPLKAAPKGKAQLRFSDNRTFACVIREMSLQMMSCVMARNDRLPTVFDQAVVDIDMEENGLARVNGYVHSIVAGENRAEANTIKIAIRFVDNDADKFEMLSKYIAQL